MKIIKRNGSEVNFDIQKIVTAIQKANETVPSELRLRPLQIQDAANVVELVATLEEVSGLRRRSRARLCEMPLLRVRVSAIAEKGAERSE